MKLDVSRVLDHVRMHTNIEVHGLLGPTSMEKVTQRHVHPYDALVKGQQPWNSKWNGRLDKSPKRYSEGSGSRVFVRRPIWLRLYQNRSRPTAVPGSCSYHALPLRRNVRSAEMRPDVSRWKK